MIYAWDNGKSDVVWLDALEQYDILLASGHSLGAGEVMKKIDRHVTSQTRCKVVAGIIEDCPLEDVLTPLEPPREMSKAINYWVAVWQRNFQPMGRMFAPRSGGIARDLSEYTDAQGVLHKLGHSQGNPGPEFESIAGDAFVWQLIELSFLMQRSFKA